MERNIYKIGKELFITYDEEIKEGDLKNGEYYLYFNKVRQFKEIDNLNRAWKDYKKIILSTDVDLIKDGVQSIDDEFLEWFINNPSCESVEIEKLCQKEVISEWWESLSDEEMKEVFKQTGNFHLGGWGHDIGPTEEDVKDMYLEVHNLDLKKVNFNIYKIIIPNIWDEILNWVAQEEPKQGLNLPLLEQKLDEALSNETEKSLNTWLKEKRDRRETLEEAAIRYEETDFNTTPTEETSQMMIQRAFINGARWQQERMYSEEESIQKIIDYVDFQFNTNGELNAEIKKWFNQFKKK